MRERILAFMCDMESNNAEKVAEWFTNESTVWIPPCGMVTGEKRIKALFRALFSRYDYVNWEILDIIPISDYRCIHICSSIGKMKHREEYNNRVITDIEFDNAGKIRSLSDYFKDTTVFARDKQVL